MRCCSSSSVTSRISAVAKIALMKPRFGGVSFHDGSAIVDADSNFLRLYRLIYYRLRLQRREKFDLRDNLARSMRLR